VEDLGKGKGTGEDKKGKGETKITRLCQELLSQYSSQHCGVYTYILAVAESSSSSDLSNRHRRLLSNIVPIPSAQLPSARS
jgi:regulator of sigma D